MIRKLMGEWRVVLVLALVQAVRLWVGDASWFMLADDTGLFSFIADVAALSLGVLVVDALHLPSVALRDVIHGTGPVADLPEVVRAATVRGYFTLQAAVFIGLALVLYT